MLLEAARALLVLAGLAVAAQGWGWLTLSLLRLKLAPAERLVLAQAAGWGVLSLPLTALGMLNLLYPAAMWPTVLAGVAVAALAWRQLAADARTVLRREALRPMAVWLPLIIAGALLALALPGALGPPAETDSLRAELAQAKYWLAHHGAVFVPNYHWNQPPLAEFLYTLGLSIGPDSLPTLIHWWMGALTALALFGLGRRILGDSAPALGALIYAATPTLAYSAASSKQELFLSLYGWLALYALLAWRRDGQRGWLALCGLMAGFGGATKLMGLYTWPALGLLLIAWLWQSGPRREMLAGLLLFGGVALAMVAPWWLRNYWSAGDPLWPAGAGLFHGRYTPPALIAFLGRVKDDFGVGRSLTAYGLGPWFITQQYAAFSDPRTPTPPSFLLFLPGLLINWRARSGPERQALAAMLVFCLGVYTFWWTQPQVPRYLYPLWGVAALACGAAAAPLLRLNWPARAAALAGLAASVFVAAGATVLFNRQYWPLYAGRLTREAYLAQHVSYYDDFRAVSALTQGKGRVLMLEALSLYYLDGDYLMGLPPWEGAIDYDRYQAGPELLPALRDLGITHILWVEKRGHVSALVEDLRAAGYLEEVYRNPAARRVTSRTLGEVERSLVVLWQVRYPAMGLAP
jgi:hypothetical protein